MRRLHFLNVKNGDCSIIQHSSGRVTVLDVCNARSPELFTESMLADAAAREVGLLGNFNQKSYPVNPISYMRDRDIDSIFRFIATHPDMDHLDGIKSLFKEFPPSNFWDTDNNCEKDFGSGENGGYKEEDWLFYKELRDTRPTSNPKRLALYSGATGTYWNMSDEKASGGDGLQILAPTKDLVVQGNECADHNDSSYVILYRSNCSGRLRKILFAGDSHDATWEHILNEHEADVSNVDLLIAPHHGRHSDRDWDFLDVVKPALTFFGNAQSGHLAYSAWHSRNLPLITNNQAGSMIVDVDEDPMDVYVTCEKFAQARNSSTFYSETFGGYYLQPILRKKGTAI
jgi:competence protein ComEC